MKKEFKKGILLAAMAVLIAAAGIAVVLKTGPHVDDGEAGHGGAQQEMVMPVTVTVIERKNLRLWTSYSGRMTAVDFVEIRPQVDGRIDEIKFEDGQIVEKGDVLLVIDPRPYEATKAEAEASVAAAKSQHEFALKELGRAEDLIKTEAISQKVLDERRNAALVVQNALNAAQAMLNKAQIDLDHAYVKAPISGRVSRAEITVGNLVKTGPDAPVLTSIVSHEGIYADFEVDEQTYLNSIRKHIDSREQESSVPVQVVLGDRVYEGHIKSFDNRINISTGTIRARAYFDNKDGALLPGMFVTVKLGSPSAEEAIILTEQAIGTDQDRKFVYVVGEDNKVAYRVVTLGASTNGSRIITSGLEPGEKVIIEGIMKVMPDMAVTPQVAGQAQGAPPEQMAGEDKVLSETAPAAGDKE